MEAPPEGGSDAAAAAAEDAAPVFLTVRGRPVRFQEDWRVGIGGGLWSTGLALAHYFRTDHADRWVRSLAAAAERNPGRTTKKLRVLELGSGNGLLSAGWLALAGRLTAELVVTDTPDHLPLVRRTLFDANPHLLPPAERAGGRGGGEPAVRVLEHRWGVFDDGAAFGGPFDVLLGSDLAYRPDLYDPLIASIRHFSDAAQRTVTLLGATMADTTPDFFRRLTAAGFEYRRVADHLLPAEFRGSAFGLFAIQRHVSSYPLPRDAASSEGVVTVAASRACLARERSGQSAQDC